MELRQIETFLRIAELGSFSRAAEKLGYSQSAVTMQMKQLERELDVRLIDRIPRGAQLTDQGRAFAFYARELMAVSQRAVAAARIDEGDEKGMIGSLRIGGVESVSTAILPELLVRFHDQHPHVELVVRTARAEALIEDMHDNRLDLFVTMDRQMSVRGLARTLLRAEDLVFVASPALDGLPGTVSLDNLSSLPLVLTERGESYRRELELLLAERDEQLHPVVETGNTETLVHLAERSVGIAYLPRFSVAAALAAGALIELPTDIAQPSMWTQLFIHKDKLMTPPLDAFIRLVIEEMGAVA